MLKPGDCVTFLLDGAKGIVIRVVDEKIYVLWEDCFASCENRERLLYDQDLTNRLYIGGNQSTFLMHA